MTALGLPAMPRTPNDIFSGLTLISATPLTPISAVPSFKIVPPSPEQSEDGKMGTEEVGDELFMPGGMASPSASNASPCSAGRPSLCSLLSASADGIGSPRSAGASTVDKITSLQNDNDDEKEDVDESMEESLGPKMENGVRPLTQAEARQLTLIMRTTLGPIARTKGLESKEAMQESIDLAHKMHKAGLRWDKRRRVMGIHLRGTWEGLEGIAGGTSKGDVAIEYIKGSFVSSFPAPHPLDEFPLDLELPDTRPSPTTPTIPTLQAGLARALGVRPLPLFLNQPAEADQQNENAHDHAHKGQYAPQTGALTAIERSFVMAPLGAAGWEGKRGGMARLRGLKGADMWVKTAAPTKTRHTRSKGKGKSLKVPLSAASLITPTRMTVLLSASSRKKKASIGLGADVMASIKSLKLKSIKMGKMGKMGRMPKIPKVPGGVVRMGQLVVPKKSFATFKTPGEAGPKEGQGMGPSYDALPGSALPTTRRVSVSGWQVR